MLWARRERWKRRPPLLALAEGILPPTANFREPIPECDLDVITGTRGRRLRSARSPTPSRSAGLNAVLAFQCV